MVHHPLGLAVGVSCLLVAAPVLHLPSGGSAQDVAGNPVSIHPGSCAVTIAEPIAELGDLLLPGREPAEASDVLFLEGPSTTIGVLSEAIDADLDDLLVAPHAIVVHSKANYGRYLACGDITAAAGEVDDVVVPLRQVEGSNVGGVAFLEPGASVFGDERVRVRAYLFSGLVAPMATPATPDAAG